VPAPDLSEFAAPAAADLEDHDLILALQDRGFVITKDIPTEREVVLSDQPEGRIRFAIVSDTHLGHRKQQLTHLQDFYTKATEWGAQFMLHGGDLVDGQNMHRDQQFELFKHGVHAQGKYAADNLPVLKNKKKQTLPTHAIGGNHDGAGFNDAGANVFDTIAAAGRHDVHFLGAPVGTFHYGPLRIRLVHPDGGVAYARSYKLQKAVEQLPPDDKPHIMLFGHWHVASHLPGYRNVEAFAVPCFQAQTAYIARKQLSPVIGGVLFEAEYDKHGLQDLTTRWVLYRTPIPEDHPK
jgi:DNA repair exonuclease SbcCD nuclease subunit